MASVHPTTVGHYRLIETIGRGGMGEVYVGYDEKLERRVALKSIRHEFRMEEEAKARFLREARILSQLEHPNICRIYDFIEGTDADFLVLELIAGESLSTTIYGEETASRRMELALIEENEREAERLFRQAIGVFQNSLGLDHPLAIPSRLHLAEVCDFTGQLEEAEREFRAVLELWRRQLPEGDVKIPEVAAYLADVLRRRGKITEATELEHEFQLGEHGLGGE